MKHSRLGTHLVVLATALSLSGGAAAAALPCLSTTVGATGTNIPVACSGNIATGFVNGRVGAKIVQALLTKGVQLDVAGVTSIGKLVAAGCAARAKVLNVLAASQAVCSKPNEIFSNVKLALYNI
jgi:hypothetical protein